ncbi:hypothetical protein BEN74_08335 [Acinetobacter sp. WCHAc010034]|nr:hypothetical protein BEN74_08335 [Acinetobacter sp. WCHAc010034]
MPAFQRSRAGFFRAGSYLISLFFPPDAAECRLKQKCGWPEAVLLAGLGSSAIVLRPEIAGNKHWPKPRRAGLARRRKRSAKPFSRQ